MRILAVIPARGGSKGVPRKNIKLMLGKPLIAYSIETALAAGELITRTIVSTEDEEIATISRQLGADVPFLRPPELASDKAPSLGLVQHSLKFVEEEEGSVYDGVLLLQPTNPLRSVEDIKSSIELFKERDCDSVISYVRVIKHHPAYMKKINEEGYIESFSVPEKEGTRRQDFTPYAYQRDGAIYLTKRDVILQQNSLWGQKNVPYIIPQERAAGIDDEKDWYEVERLLSKR